MSNYGSRRFFDEFEKIKVIIVTSREGRETNKFNFILRKIK